MYIPSDRFTLTMWDVKRVLVDVLNILLLRFTLTMWDVKALMAALDAMEPLIVLP